MVDSQNASASAPLPVDLVFAPDWWNQHEGIAFDEDFFFHPARRVEEERRMEKALHERWGRFGFGEAHGEDRPEVGAVHLAAGYLLSGMLGCGIRYHEAAPPDVETLGREDLRIDPEEAFRSEPFRKFAAMMESMKERHGYLKGDVNWGGVLNLAQDLRGNEVYLDLLDDPDATAEGFRALAAVIDRFTDLVERETGTSSVSVNRTVRWFDRPVFLHSECSHTMIATEQYEELLLPLDIEWSKRRRPFGIHYCGEDPHRYAASFAKIPHLDFLDVGWGGDVAELRRHLPETFLNVRLSPIEMVRWTPEEVRATVRRLVADAADPRLTGVCCINMDANVPEENVTALLETVGALRREATGAQG